MRFPIPSYVLLCESGVFRGHDGLDEVYELDGRLYGVSEEPGPWGGSHFSVYVWPGDPAALDRTGPGLRSASAA